MAAEKPGFFSGLAVGLLVVVFSQFWSLYNKNEDSRAAIFEVRDELLRNKAVLEEGKKEIEGLKQPTSVMAPRRRLADDISFAAYERNVSGLARGGKTNVLHVMTYYSRLTQFVRAEATAYAGLASLGEAVEQSESRFDRYVQHRDFLVVNENKLTNFPTLLSKTKELVKILSENTNALEQIRSDVWGNSRQIIGNHIEIVLSSGEVADKALDVMLVRLERQDWLLIGIAMTVLAVLLYYPFLHRRRETEH